MIHEKTCRCQSCRDATLYKEFKAETLSNGMRLISTDLKGYLEILAPKGKCWRCRKELHPRANPHLARPKRPV